MSITLTSPEAAVAATPYLSGFTPVDSLVMLLCEETGLRVTMRIDLPDCPQAGWLIDVLDALGDPPPRRPADGDRGAVGEAAGRGRRGGVVDDELQILQARYHYE